LTIRRRDREDSGVRPLAESALLAAITVLLMFIGAYLPLAGLFVVLAWPVPVMIVIMRHGTRYGVLAVAVTVFLATMFLGALQALFAGVTLVGFIGLAFGVGLERNWNAATLVGAGTVAVTMAFLVAILVSGPLMGVNLFEQIQFMLTESVERAADMYIRLGLDQQAVEETREQMEMALVYLQMVFPAVLMFSALTYALWTYFMTRLILPRLGYEVPNLTPFADWRAPIWLAFILLGAFAADLLAPGGESLLSVLAGNVLFASDMIYRVFGVSLLYFFLRHFLRSRWLAGGAVAFLSLNAVVYVLLPLVGILDSGLDIRRRFRSRTTG
jgi:uncharacterized protein YybS (DUF2232 family)